MPTSNTFTLLHGQITLTIPSGYPKPPQDALWLADSLTPPPGSHGLDAGCGIGTAALALLACCPGVTMHGVDIAPDLTVAAAQNAQTNALPFTAEAADILTHRPAKPYDFILCNPPFHAAARGHTSPNPRQLQRHSMPKNLLATWLPHLISLLKSQGTLALILHTHQTEEIQSLAQTLNLHATLTPLQTSETRPAKRMIVHLLKS